MILTVSVTNGRLFPKLLNIPPEVTFFPGERSIPTIIIHPVDDLRNLFHKIGRYIGLSNARNQTTTIITTTTPMTPVTENGKSLFVKFWQWVEKHSYSKPKRRYKEPILRPLEIFYPSLRKRHSTKFIFNFTTIVEWNILFAYRLKNWA